MTETKKKAEMLVKQFLPFMHPFHDEVAKKQAKKCALITIDEVLQDDWFIEKVNIIFYDHKFFITKFFKGINAMCLLRC